MSWFDATNFANLAKNALKEAKKTFDEALEINEEPDDGIQNEVNEQKKEIEVEKTVHTEPKRSSNVLWETLGMPFFDKPKISQNSETHEDKTAVISEELNKTETKGKCQSIDAERIEGSNLINENSSQLADSYGVKPPEFRSSVRDSSDNALSDEMSPDELNDLAKSVCISESVEIILDMKNDEHKCNKDGKGMSDAPLVIESSIVNDPCVSPILSTSDNISPCDVCVAMNGLGSSISRTIDIPDLQMSPFAEIVEKLPHKRTMTELSGTSITTLDSSSCDEGTMIGSSSDEAPKECTSSVGSLKSMLADAIKEQSDDWTVHGSSPTTSSPESRKEIFKVCSSDHTSGDELETTSSDIEVISSPNGDGSSTNSRQSPAKLIYKSSKGKMSVVLSSEVLVPEVLGRSLIFKGHNREPSEASSGGSDESIEVDKLFMKIAELHELLEARESKLMDLSMKNAELSESNSNLKSQREFQMNEEFTQRIASLDKKFQQAIRDKEALKKQLENFKRTDSTEFEEDKDQIIKELREEGEKLSKQQLAANLLIKKLRSTEKDNSKLISSLRQQYDGIMQELERAKKSLNAKEELERSQIEAINQLTKSNQSLEKQSHTLLSQVDNLTSSLVTLQKEFEEKESKIVNLEIQFKTATSLYNEELLQKTEADLHEECERRLKLELSLSNLQQTLQNAESQHSQQETALRKENQKLRTMLEDYKTKNENLTEQMLTSTKPIVKQLEVEISKRNVAAEYWSKLEKELMSTISELQDKLKLLENTLECEKLKTDSLQHEIQELKSENLILKRDLENKDAQLDLHLKTNQSLREKSSSELTEKLEEIAALKDQLEESRSNKLRLNDSSFEKARNFSDTYKEDRLKLKSLLLGETHIGDGYESDNSVRSPSSSQFSEESNTWLGGMEDDPGPSSSQKGSVYEGISKPLVSATGTIEHLQTQNKLKEGEVQQLQWELKKYEHERTILTNEITILATKVEELEKRLSAHCDLQTQYDALLQMYGEKMEECQELKLDLEDVKEMYKIQIDELLSRSRNSVS